MLTKFLPWANQTHQLPQSNSFTSRLASIQHPQETLAGLRMVLVSTNKAKLRRHVAASVIDISLLMLQGNERVATRQTLQSVAIDPLMTKATSLAIH
jgi:hypothetical protein